MTAQTTATAPANCLTQDVRETVLILLVQGKLDLTEAQSLINTLATMPYAATLTDDIVEYVEESHHGEYPISGDDFELYLDCVNAGS